MHAKYKKNKIPTKNNVIKAIKETRKLFNELKNSF